MKKVGLMVVLAVLALACSETVGGMMQDAGDMLADAGDVIRDAGNAMVPDAGAQQSKSVTCTEQATSGGNPFFRYALVDVGDAKQKDVYVRYVYKEVHDCPDGATCTGRLDGGYSTYHHAALKDGKAYVWCSDNTSKIYLIY